jgi:hypothetical protein
MTDTDISTARKQHATELKVIVAIQVISLCAAVFLLLLFNNHDPALLPAVISFVAGCCGLYKLANPGIIVGLPISIRYYANGGFLLITLSAILARHFFLVSMLIFCIFPFYCIIPQFLIARWLAKESK